MGRLDGKRVLITGTGGGQGLAAMEMFAREGARVRGCDLVEGAAEAAAESLVAKGFDVEGATVDLSEPEPAGQWVHTSAEGLGGIDVIYNNAAGYGFAPFSAMTIDLFRHVLKVEVELVFNTTRPAWDYLSKQGGSVINTGSVAALRGMAPLAQVAHATGKGAVVSFTRALAAEGAELGIRCNSISPGFVTSPGTDAAVPDELREFILQTHLIRRPGTGDDIAACATYLASDESTWVTGQNFCIDGGWTAGDR